MSTDNRSLVNLTRLSRDATLKLERILRFGATALRDKILDEELNRQAERYDTLSSQDTLTFEAAGALKAVCEVAVAPSRLASRIGIWPSSALRTGTRRAVSTRTANCTTGWPFRAPSQFIT